jgi:hypothetical protein
MDGVVRYFPSEEMTMEKTRRITLVLERKGILTLPLRERAHRISCVTGMLWITVDGSREDHVLFPGDERAFRARGKAIIQAMSTAVMRIDFPVKGRRAAPFIHLKRALAE